jgi:hypothetical protein
LQKDPARRFVNAEAMRQALMATGDDATLPVAIAPTAILPTQSRVEGRTRPLPLRAALIAVGAGLLLVAGLLVALAGGNNDSLTSKTRSTTAPSLKTFPPTAVPSTTTPTTSVTRTTTAPKTLDALIALLAANPAAYGEHGRDLLMRLQDVQRAATKQGEGGRNVAAKAIEDIRTWMNQGKLDRSIGLLAQQILQPFSTKYSEGDNHQS